MYIKDSLLIPDWKDRFSNLVCGFTLPFYGNQALTRVSHSHNRTLKDNRTLLATHLGIDLKTIFSPHQVHSDTIIYVDDNLRGLGSYSLQNALQGDSCYTDLQNNLLLVTWADCIPVILFEPDRVVVAAIHSGWRGTKDKIVTKTINKVLDMGGDITKLYVAIGPGIKGCCYKVGYEVVRYFDNECCSSYIRESGNDFYLDLQGVVYEEVVRRGVKIDHIDNYGLCNSCNKDINFFSCRKDGKDLFEGQAAFIGVY